MYFWTSIDGMSDAGYGNKDYMFYTSYLNAWRRYTHGTNAFTTQANVPTDTFPTNLMMTTGGVWMGAQGNDNAKTAGGGYAIGKVYASTDNFGNDFRQRTVLTESSFNMKTAGGKLYKTRPFTITTAQPLYRSDTMGKTWTALGTLPVASVLKFGVSDYTGTMICFGTKTADNAKLYRSTNGGASWSQITMPALRVVTTTADWGNAGHPVAGANGIWMMCMWENATTPRMYRSADDGLTWSLISTIPASLPMFSNTSTNAYPLVDYDPVGNVWCVAVPRSSLNTNPGVIYVSTDGGVNWTTKLQSDRVIYSIHSHSTGKWTAVCSAYTTTTAVQGVPPNEYVFDWRHTSNTWGTTATWNGMPGRIASWRGRYL